MESNQNLSQFKSLEYSTVFSNNYINNTSQNFNYNTNSFNNSDNIYFVKFIFLSKNVFLFLYDLQLDKVLLLVIIKITYFV